MNRLRVVVSGLLMLITANGCGYSTDSLLATTDDGRTIQTVWVPIVSNDSDRRQFEEPLTDAIIKELQATTGLRVVARDQNPDSELRLTLQEVLEQTSIENRLDVLVQGSLLFYVSIEWIDLRTGEPIPLVSKLVSDQKTFTATRGESFATAAAEVSEEIAEKIVENMFHEMN